MALGGNLKKKSLIPTEEKSKAAKTTPKKMVKKATAKKKEKSAPKKTKAATSSKPKSTPTKPKSTSEQKVESKAEVIVRDRTPVLQQGRLSKMEYNRRLLLHERFSVEVKALKGKRVHLIVFQIENEEFAIEISKVSEVVVTPTITRMPQAPKYVPGIATIRGKGVVTLDLAYKLGYVENTDLLKDRSGFTIVVKTERFNVGLLVSDVPKNQMINGDIVQPASDSVSETSLDETYIKGLIRLDNRMIFYIDIDEMIEGDRLKARLIED
ncbi:MAG: chemotaxis protein CheW [Marinoscillum sp.]